MIPRTLEPEVMDSLLEAIDYNSMDHSEVNRAFVDNLLLFCESVKIDRKLTDCGMPSNVLDVGTGTALIPIELFQRQIRCRVTAIDLAQNMLKVARENVVAASLSDEIHLQQVDAKNLPYQDGQFDVVMSNSIVHHIADPKQVLAEMIRVVCPNGCLFVRDLLRPNDLGTLNELVYTYAQDANDHQQQMFRDSLHAALTVDEVREILEQLDISQNWIVQTNDRHWTIVGTCASDTTSTISFDGPAR